MILAHLFIRDYKQFAGEHEFEPDRQGITAVIGPNGAGKTTLFEAIEWCLYGPRSIANSHVMPRGTGGSPLVRITLEEPRAGQRYVIERRLSRSKIMQADVWDEANPGEMIATGSAPVKKFVSEQLIGLGHAAFIATFFTRQKELSFFGAHGDTKRRRMVGQMIGIEAVRLAQEAIGDERTKAAATADALGAVAAQDAGERDFAAELRQAETDLAGAASDVQRRLAESATARQALDAANQAAEVARARAEQDRDLAAKLAEFEATRARLESRIEGFDADLARLAELATRRESLIPLAVALPERQATVERWAAEQRRQLQIEERLRALRSLEAERANTIASIGRLVSGSATPHLPDWQWRGGDSPETEIRRLLEVNAANDVAAQRQHLAQIEAVHTRLNDLDRAKGDLKKYRARLLELEGHEQQLLAAGDPKATIESIRASIDGQRTLAAQHVAEQQQAIDRARQLVPLVTSLRERTFDDHCPTCGRSISEEESAGVIATLSEQIESWNGLARQRNVDAAAVRTKVADLERQLAAAQQSLDALTDVRNKLSNGRQLTADKDAEVTRLEAALAHVRPDPGAPLPTQDDIDRLKQQVEALSDVAAAAQGLAQRFAQLQELAQREAREREELEQLGEVAYDADAHRQATAALDEANRAATTLTNIERDLDRQADITAQRAESATLLEQANQSIREVTIERSALAYDETESATARTAVNGALESDRNATSRLHLAQTAERDRHSALKRLREEKARLDQALARSATLRRQADDLSEMYKEFGLFDQFVASRVAPRLAEQTSELLDIATDGKYTSVEFDENYGIEVYDGVHEKFPLEGFSGGERDVVALCARLALSQLIGSSAAHPPSFLVLDEVFGALDRDRRVQLLELLGRISESIEAFQQMFIISHVDDVRSSPIFSRVIRITETASGASQIEDATVSASLEE